MGSVWQKCISKNGTIRGVGIQATEVVQELAQIHGLRGQDAQALGEAIIGGFLLASYAKAGERMNLNIKSNGWVKQVLVDAYPNGSIRGYHIPSVAFKIHEGRGPWGEGLLSVLRQREGQGRNEPYIGTVPLLTGHLAKDLAYYWRQSEQVPTAVGISVGIDSQGQVIAAGGFLVQGMPGATEKELIEIEDRVNALADLAKKVSPDQEPIQLLYPIFQDMAFVLLEKKALRAECQCSWERVKRALLLLGKTELQAMIDETGEANIKCDFCQKNYRADLETLQALVTGESSA